MHSSNRSAIMSYTKTVTYLEPTKLNNWKRHSIPTYNRLKIDPHHPSYHDAGVVFDQERFKYPYLPLYMGQYDIDVNAVNLNVLRLIISQEGYDIIIPEQFEPLKEFIMAQCNYHRQHYPKNNKPYIYITIRTTDGDCYYQTAQDWHVDGFQGGSSDRHIPEQDIVWSNCNPTEFTLQPVFCEGLNPNKHNIVNFFNETIEENDIYTAVENGVYLMTPYNVHRVSTEKFEGKRVFIRLTFSPVPILDKTNTPNPCIPMVNYRHDVRDFLWDYKSDEFAHSGFKKK